MWLLVAAAPAAPVSNEVIVAVSGVLVAVVTAIAGVVVALANSRKPRDTESGDEDWGPIRERTAILENRADDADDQREIQDRRLDRIERHLDLDNPYWQTRR